MKFSDLEYFPPKLTPELDDLKTRAVRVANALDVAGPLRYIGAGASGVVFEASDIAFKVARLGPPASRYRDEIMRQKRIDFLSEAEWILDAEMRDLSVAGLVYGPDTPPGYWVHEIVIAKKFINGTPGNPGTRGLQDLWRYINTVMSDRWGPIEFKESNFVVEFVNRPPVLVDCGGAVRRGVNLLKHSMAVAHGVIDDPDGEPRGPRKDESYLRWSIRMDTQDGRISEADAERVISALDARYGAPAKPNPPARRPYVPCAPGVHARALEDDTVWATWPLVSIDKQMGLETRRCPACSSTQSRLLESAD